MALEERTILLGFQYWLALRSPDEIVGVRGEANSCPLAEYVRKKHHWHGVYVTSYHIYFRSRWLQRQLDLQLREGSPLQRFIFLVDTGAESQITAREALRVLGEAMS